MPRASKILTREDVEKAIRNTKSNRAAARFCRVSYNHYKKYASLYINPKTGKTLYEEHLNVGGKGVPKFALSEHSRSKREPLVLDILEGRVPMDHYNPQKLKYKIVELGLVEPKCAHCGFHEKRLVDGKSPLILAHKNGNNKDYHLDNLEFICYNCAFLAGGKNCPVTEEFVEKAEEYVDKNGKKEREVFELEGWQKKYLQSLGIHPGKEEKPYDKYISKI